jgi:UPF0755 protein
MKKSLILISILLIALIGAYFWYQSSQYELYISTVVDYEDEDKIPFHIDKGESVKSIAKRLEKEDIIISSWAFYKYVKKGNLGPEVEAGRFLLRKSYTIPEIVDYLTRAMKDDEPLTIVEGLTIEQVDDFLAEEGVLQDGEFETCAKSCVFDFDFLKDKPANVSLEGYLFPDTYFIDPEATTAEILIKRMLNNFEIRTADLFKDEERSIHDIVIMASIIEKEEKKSSQRPTVAGVLWKRYDNGIGLGADATVRYAKNKWTEPLTLEDLDVDSPYNTRKYRGLPPGPIGSPGLDSIKASLLSEESPYWYYLHDSDGIIHYAKTLEEHNANKQKYL